MPINKLLGRSLRTRAQLALVLLLSAGFTATTHDSIANTLSSLKMKVIVTAPSKEDLAAAAKTDRLDKDMGALSPKEASLYRALFAAQERKDWSRAETLQKQITDKRLIAYALADRYTRKGAKPDELAAWLEANYTLPGAEDIYALATKAGVSGAKKPQIPEEWSSGNDIDGAVNFTPELANKEENPSSPTTILAKAIQKALRKGDPWAARNILINAQTEHAFSGTFAHDAEAVIAASFFTLGERDQATALSTAAAGAAQPLGLWIRGLIAWENGESAMARKVFSALADHPALNDTNRAAANFWAYRAEIKDGSRSQARKYLEAAATTPRSLYGLLASQLLGRNPFTVISSEEKKISWEKTHRQNLLVSGAGWRALALIQVGQLPRAEAELRRLNPQNETAIQQAMLALADYIPLPALALQIGKLSKERGIDTALYPLPPWKPQEGFQVDRALLFALARHESLFDPSAVSTKGAQGLMQIMPATAKIMATDLGLPADAAHKAKLMDPAHNMALGQKYVQTLSAIPQIGNNLVKLLAAYNGGPAKAINWANSRDGSDPLLFLESLPNRETRKYIARVLPHYWAYRAKLGKSLTSVRQMAEGKWPIVSLTEESSLRVAAIPSSAD